MAFLCPVRIRRNKKKHDDAGQFESQLLMAGLSTRAVPPAQMLGRITGSASIETLVRVGLEKEAGLSPDSKMMVLHDFQPCVDDELGVCRGQIVNVLYQENDWVYVIAENQTEGFIPLSYCAPIDPPNNDASCSIYKKKLPRTAPNSPKVCKNDSAFPDQSSSSSCVGKSSHLTSREATSNVFRNATLPRTFGGSVDHCSFLKPPRSSLDSVSKCLGQVTPFPTELHGKFVVLWPFIGNEEDDLSVEQGEIITVFNQNDPHWLWAQRSDHSSEGFVPANHVCSLDVLLSKLLLWI